MKKLFEYRKVYASGTALTAPDVTIIFTKAPFIQYEQILLDKNFRQYLEIIMVSKKILRMGAQKTPMQVLLRTPLTLTFEVQIDNLIGSNCLLSTIKATNTTLYTTVTMLKWHPKK